MDRILITGASGFLGGHIVQQAQKRWRTFGTYLQHALVPAGAEAVPLDLFDKVAIDAALARIDPAVVIHAAVLQVDECEALPRLAQVVNVEATEILAQWCTRKHRRFVYISSDMVFDGGSSLYKESDATNPILAYGHSKLEGERVTLEHCPTAAVARLPLMYGNAITGRANFFISMRERLQKRETVKVFKDQFRTPGLVNNMAEAVLELATTDFSGVMHIAGTTRCSREEMARAACRLAGLDEGLLFPVSMFDVSLPVMRPQDVSLSTSLAQGLLESKLLSLEEGLRVLL